LGERASVYYHSPQGKGVWCLWPAFGRKEESREKTQEKVRKRAGSKAGPGLQLKAVGMLQHGAWGCVGSPSVRKDETVKTHILRGL
jgi:hypothetical protein